jgi:hypothetical protein
VAQTHKSQQGQFHPPPPPTRRLERIQEELEDSPKLDGKIARSGRLSDEGGESSGKSFWLLWEGKRKGSSPTTRLPATRTTPLDSPHSIDLDDLSIPSSKDFFLQNINHDLSRDVPLLIEDRLKDLFSNFLSDLSGTVDSIPSTLLESCLKNFNLSMKNSISKLIKDEIVPSLIEKVIDNLSDKVSKEPSNHHCLRYVEEVKLYIDKKLEDFQDILFVRDTENVSKFEEVKKEMRSSEGRTAKNFQYISTQISEFDISENNRFEQLKRRIGDVCQTTYGINNKLLPLT